MNCQLCDRRTFYYGKFAPCPDCKGHNSVVPVQEVTKSASIEIHNTVVNSKPYWITLMEQFGDKK